MNRTNPLIVTIIGFVIIVAVTNFGLQQYFPANESAPSPVAIDAIIPTVSSTPSPTVGTAIPPSPPTPTANIISASTSLPRALSIGPGVIYPIGGEKWQQGASYEVKWNRGELSEPVSIEAFTQDYGEKTPSGCKIFFSVDNVDPLLEGYSFKIPDDACSGRYKIQICEYNKAVLEKSVCYEDKGYFQISPKPEVSCSNPSAITDWGDGLYGCSAGRDQSQQRCYNGECKICSGTLAYDQSANKIGCWYLADPGMSCKDFCEGRGLGATVGFSNDIWGDDQSCTNGKKLTGCNKCSTNYNNGYWTPYYDITKNICYHYPGAGVYYTAYGKPDSTSYQRLCVCNY